MEIEISSQKIINNLLKERFYIPAYQRGYRWTEQEVGDLLDDLYEFDTGTHDKPLQYCLQPLIVQKRSEGDYEVVDGQQRLTTIFIFLKYVSSMTQQEPYKLEYATRPGSQEFLEKLSDYDGSIISDNIDYYHITKAYNKIKSWLKDKEEQGATRFFIVSTMYNKIVHSTFFIWYEVPEEENTVELFNRVNIGKIRLSNAELIKALLFNKNNFDISDEKYSERRQQELALSWDSIERGLQNDSFWFF